MNYAERTKAQLEKMRADTAKVLAGTMELDRFVDDNFDILYDMHMSEMPYGTAKARDGDPYAWLFDLYYGKFFGGQGQ